MNYAPETREAATGWVEANQRCLAAEFTRIGALLDAAGGQGTAADVARAQQRVTEARAALSDEAAIDLLTTALALSAFERDIVLLAAGAEMETAIAQRLAVHGSATPSGATGEATFGVALGALPDAHWSALTPGRPLRRWPLVQLGSGALTSAPLRLEERVLHFLVGINELDATIEPLVREVDAAPFTAPSQLAVSDAVAAAWHDPIGPWPAVHLHGDDADGHEDLAWHAAAKVGLSLYVMRADDLPAGARERAALASIWTRESVLLNAALLIRVTADPQLDQPADGSAGTSTGRGSLAGFLDRVQAPVIVSSRHPLTPALRTRYAVDRPGPLEQRHLWRLALGDAADAWAEPVDIVSSQFRLSARSILQTGHALVNDPALTLDDRPGPWNPSDPSNLGRFYRELRRTVPGPVSDGLVQRIEPVSGWGDLVLPEDRTDTLRELAGQVRHRTQVYEEWGFAARGSRGLGISAVFAGESGTGKTMAAEVLAHELGLELFRIDLSSVVSKYIGETEKNLRRVFDVADESGAILLFDEADALFGKRSEVRDSHDRYANIEVSYLLQRMEEYRGLAVLTTNAKSALDRSFHRRLRFVVQFPFPDAAHRARIWHSVFPPSTPVDGLDYHRLARLNLSGGAIRNIAVLAAFRAAAADTAVTMPHLAWAVRAELAKAEKVPSEADLRGWDA